MICPVCKLDMIDIEYERIELDYCVKCRGVWFDAEELELLLEKMGIQEHDLLLDDVSKMTEAATSEKGRKCPVCDRRMKKTSIGDKEGVLIDACVQGDGLWFDGGEVNQLLKQIKIQPSAGDTSQGKVLAFLGEVFKAEE